MTDTTALVAAKHCGRLDLHPEHVWTLARHLVCGVMVPATEYRCPGFVLIEGGSRAKLEA